MRFSFRLATWENVFGILVAGVGSVVSATAEQPGVTAFGWATIVLGLLILLHRLQINGYYPIDWLKGRRHRARLYRNRRSFQNEIVDLRKLVDPDGVIDNRSFEACILHHPQIKFRGWCKINRSSMSNSQWVVLPEEAPLVGVANFLECRFDRCLFDRSAFVGTQADYDQLAPQIDDTTIRAWKKRVWHGK